MTHGALTESSLSYRVVTHDRKGREGKGKGTPCVARIHRLGSRRDRARVIAARHTPTTATMDGSLRELRGGGC